MNKIARDAKVPVCLHFDHGTDYKKIMSAIKCGFSSVMYDGSGLSDDDFRNTIKNGIRKVNICTEMCLALHRAFAYTYENKISYETSVQVAKSTVEEVVTCDIGDLMVYEGSKEQRDKVVDVIRSVQPDFIITHPPTDYMPDHVAVSRLVFDATFAASVGHYKTSVSQTAAVTPIYYMDNLAGVNSIPTEYVDITNEIETKIEMLECHVSQMKWMRDHDNLDFADFVRTSAKYRGYQCGVPYAEAFTSCLAWPKIKPMRLLP